MSGRPQQRNPSRQGTGISTPYVDAMDNLETLNDPMHRAPTMSHKASQAFSTHDLSGGDSQTLSPGHPGMPQRTNTTASSQIQKKRSSTHILESKMPKIFRMDVPAADEVVDIEANKGHGHRFGWHRARHDISAIHAKLSKRLEAKNLIVAGLAEFMGTFLFLFFALAINTTVSNVKDAEQAAGATGTNIMALLVSSLGFGFSLVISAWVFFRVSGGVQNPAITLALTIVGALDWKRCIILTIFQYVGGIAASALISALLPGNVNSRTTLGDGVSTAQGFWLEFFLSIELIFTVLMLACEKHRATYLAPVGIGLALFNTQLFGQPYTGASVNPARTLGPDVAQVTFADYCWIYYIAPYAAALLSSGIYLGLKWVKYETTAPDQDADEAGSGLKRQVIMDGQGNIIGTIDEVAAEDFHIEEVADEKGPTTMVEPTEIISSPSHGETYTLHEGIGQSKVIYPDQHFQVYHPEQPEPAASIDGRNGGYGAPSRPARPAAGPAGSQMSHMNSQTSSRSQSQRRPGDGLTTNYSRGAAM